MKQLAVIFLLADVFVGFCISTPVTNANAQFDSANAKVAEVKRLVQLTVYSY